MTTYEIIAQVIGFIGLAFGILAFQCKRHKNIMLCKATDEIFVAIQYFMLGAYTGMALDSISVVRNFIYAELVKKKKSTLVAQIVFSILFIVAGIFTWAGILSICAILAKVISCIAYGFKNETLVRTVHMPSMFLWLYYNISVHAFASVISDVMIITSIIIGIIRYDIIPYAKKKKEKNTNEQQKNEP